MPEQPNQLVARLTELALAEVDSHALVMLNPNGIIVGWLAGAEKLFGYRSEEIVGQNVALLFTPEDLSNGLSAWELATAADSGMSEDDRWQVRRDGGRIWVSGTLTALRDEQNQLLGFAKIMRNHTDVKFQIETLETRIFAHEQAVQSKNQFISTLGHELRNPLAAISNATELLRLRESNSPDLSLAVGMIQRQIEFMGRIINDVMEVSRSAAGKVEIHKERVVLQELIAQALETCQASIHERQHKVQLLVPEAPLYLNADPVCLRQVFVNLIQNAVKYTQPAGTIWTKATAEGAEAVVRVQDTGIGIPPEVMPHIFDLFTQATSATTSQGGLGIGLSVVKDNVTRHGGTVQAASDGVGKGSEFTVRLPLMSDAR